MTYVIAQDGSAFGPFTSVQVTGDRLVCDSVQLPLSVIGAYTTTQTAPGPTASQVKVQQAALQADIVADTQKRLDDFARATFTDAQGRVHGDYDGVNSASKYANLSDAQIAAMPIGVQPLVAMFRTDCQYLAAVTAQTWAVLWATLAQVQAGNWPTAGAAQTPTGYSDIEPSLPALAWPN